MYSKDTLQDQEAVRLSFLKIGRSEEYTAFSFLVGAYDFGSPSNAKYFLIRVRSWGSILHVQNRQPRLVELPPNLGCDWNHSTSQQTNHNDSYSFDSLPRRNRQKCNHQHSPDQTLRIEVLTNNRTTPST